MRTTISSVWVTVGLGISSCAAPSGTPVTSFEVAIAPLTLPGISKVCYDLRVTNAADGGGATVWAEGNSSIDGVADTGSVCSNKYGNGVGGGITFVGSCDATPVNAGDTGRTNSVTVWVDSLYDASSALIAADGADGWQDPCPAGCTLNATCQENADTRVDFNLTILRQANQGFFDIGVNFEDIFCSAKVDCKNSSNEALKLLFNPATGQRDTTVVSAFACTAGAGSSGNTVLYRDPLKITCGSVVTEVWPDTGRGNAWSNAAADPAPADAVWQYAIYADEEALTCGGQPCNKRFWNVAFGLDSSVDNCRLTTTMSASSGDFTAYMTPALTTYPYIDVSIDLTDTNGLVCNKHPLNGTNSNIATKYTAISTPEIFETDFDGTNFSRRSTCNPACQNGGICNASNQCVCPAGWTGPTCLTPSIVTSGLLLDVDAGDVASYSGTGTTWTDMSVNANHGTRQNGAPFSSAFEGGFVFNGTNQYFAFGNPSSLNPTTGVTFEAWLSPDAVADAMHGDGIISKGVSTDGNSASYELLLGQNNGKNYPYCRIHNTAARSYVPIAQALEIGANYHVVCTYDGQTLRLYLNGVEVGTGLATTGNLQVNSGQLTVGVRSVQVNNGFDSFFTGSIYAARVYGRGLTSSEVLQNFEADRNRYLGATAPAYSGTGLQLDLDAGLVSSYRGTGTSWLDLSGNNRHGTLNYGPRFAPLDQGSIIFDGTDDHVLSGGLTLTNSYSFELWFKPAVSTSVTLFSSKNYYATGFPGNFILRLTNPTTLDFATYNGKSNEEWQALTVPSVPTNRWSHVILSNNAGSLKVYLNGVEVGSLSNSKSLSDAANGIVLGDDISWTNLPFNGNIGLFRVYNRGLTATEVTSSYRGTKARYELMLGYDFARKFTFFPFSTAAVVDYTGRGNDGTANNGPLFGADGGGSLLFDGANDHIAFGNSLGNGFEAITVSVWVKLSSLLTGYYTQNTIIAADDGSSNGLESVFAMGLMNFDSVSSLPASFIGRHLFFGVRSQAQAERIRPIGIADNSIWVNYLPGVAIAKNPPGLVTGEWLHIAGVYTGSTTLVYLNGVLAGSSAAQPDGGSRNVSGVLNTSSISRMVAALSDANANTYNFPGRIRSVRISRAALSAAEILAEFQELDAVLNP